MTERRYLKLPINADEGFPQSFQFNFDNRIYRILLYVNALEQESEIPEDYIYTLPEAGAFMVMQVARETAGAPEIIFWRKIVPNLEYEAEELAFVFRKMQVSKRNLNGIGDFDSQVIGGVAARWVS